MHCPGVDTLPLVPASVRHLSDAHWVTLVQAPPAARGARQAPPSTLWSQNSPLSHARPMHD